MATNNVFPGDLGKANDKLAEFIQNDRQVAFIQIFGEVDAATITDSEALSQMKELGFSLVPLSEHDVNLMFNPDGAEQAIIASEVNVTMISKVTGLNHVEGINKIFNPVRDYRSGQTTELSQEALTEGLKEGDQQLLNLICTKVADQITTLLERTGTNSIAQIYQKAGIGLNDLEQLCRKIVTLDEQSVNKKVTRSEGSLSTSQITTIYTPNVIAVTGKDRSVASLIPVQDSDGKWYVAYGLLIPREDFGQSDVERHDIDQNIIYLHSLLNSFAQGGVIAVYNPSFSEAEILWANEIPARVAIEAAKYGVEQLDLIRQIDTLLESGVRGSDELITLIRKQIIESSTPQMLFYPDGVFSLFRYHTFLKQFEENLEK